MTTPDPDVLTELLYAAEDTLDGTEGKAAYLIAHRDAFLRALGLHEETRAVPVAESGFRWQPRSHAAAQVCLKEYPAGGSYADGEPWDGLTHIEQEHRFVTGWEDVDAEQG